MQKAEGRIKTSMINQGNLNLGKKFILLPE
jgi:hypothetical protein